MNVGSATALVAAVAVGFGLRIWQYRANPSLGLDEIALAHGILGRDLGSLLLLPLPYDQVAPKGFLLAQKLAVTVLGPSDHVLRLFRSCRHWSRWLGLHRSRDGSWTPPAPSLRQRCLRRPRR